MNLNTKKMVVLVGIISIILNLFGCSGVKNETVTIEGNKFIVLKVGEAVTYKAKKGESEVLFIFTAPETGVYTIWNQSEEYAFCRIYNGAALDWSIYSDCEIEPFIKSFPLEAGENAYIGSINFSSDEGYEGIVTIDYRKKAPTPYENYGFPIKLEVGDVIPFNYEYNYTPVVYEFAVPKDGTYLFYTDGDGNAMPYLNIFSDPWCRSDSLMENIDHTEIPDESYYTVEDGNFSKALKLKEGDVIYPVLSVRAVNSEGNFYLKFIEE